MRKATPICTGMLDYFPRAAAYVARISVLGNDKHNPGEPLHWAKGKSTDQPDCIVRHVIERGTFDPDDGALHDGKLAWRALANLETELEKREADGTPAWDEEIIAKNKKILSEKLAAKNDENLGNEGYTPPPVSLHRPPPPFKAPREFVKDPFKAPHDKTEEWDMRPKEPPHLEDLLPAWDMRPKDNPYVDERNHGGVGEWSEPPHLEDLLPATLR
jgi:hypothetical protein